MRPNEIFSLNLLDVKFLIGATSTTSDQDLALIIATGAAHSDSEIENGDVFLAFSGLKKHGAIFSDSAQARGAVARVTDIEGVRVESTLPTLVVSDARIAGAIVAASLYRNPTRDLVSIGITGTNGKTTVSTLIFQIFEMAGRDSGLIGTVETRIGKDVIASKRTTPEASELQALVATMRERHVRNLVMEVSSHAISLNRVKGSHFSFLGFTNLSQDHLDFHNTMEEYFQVKASLFTYEYGGSAFINIDDPYGARLASNCELPVRTLARLNPKALWHFVHIYSGLQGSGIAIRGVGGILIETTTQLRGDYNLDNLLMAVAIAYECGIDPLDMAAIIPRIAGPVGRLEAIDLGQPFGALIDYAHSPDAVESVLKSARSFSSHRIIAVLGCGGDRDASKRPLMGAALQRGSDVAIFTSDNPRSENPATIISQMQEGLTLKAQSIAIEDRASAINYAVEIAEPGDVVLILGKGHEKGQDIGGVVTPFDDRLVLARAIEAKK